MTRKFGVWLLTTMMIGSLCSCGTTEPTPTPTPVPTHTATPAPTPAQTPNAQNDVSDNTWEDEMGAARHAVKDAERAVEKTKNKVEQNFDTMVENGKVR